MLGPPAMAVRCCFWIPDFLHSIACIIAEETTLSIIQAKIIQCHSGKATQIIVHTISCYLQSLQLLLSLANLIIVYIHQANANLKYNYIFSYRIKSRVYNILIFSYRAPIKRKQPKICKHLAESIIPDKSNLLAARMVFNRIKSNRKYIKTSKQQYPKMMYPQTIKSL